MWLCCRFRVKLSGFIGGSRKREKLACRRLRGRRERERELLPGGKLSSLCLPWDSSAALNMPVIFNQRRNRAQRQPPLLEYFLSVRRGNGGEPHFLVTWCSPGRDRKQGEQGKVKEGRRGSLAGPEFNPLSWPDEASDETVCFNQRLRRQKPEEPGL